MARPKKTTVDYFPHQTTSGPTLFILESRWGNDGYSFWFKLLETLGAKNGMFLDCKKSSDWQFLLAKTRVNEETANSIIQCLADLDAINKDVWEEHKVIYSQNLVDNVSDAFNRRKEQLPSLSGVIAYINPAKVPKPSTTTGKGKERERKGKEIIEVVKVGIAGNDETPQQQNLRNSIISNRKKLLQLSKTVTNESFDSVAELCIAYYRKKPYGVDPYAVALRWFMNQRGDPSGKGAESGQQMSQMAKGLAVFDEIERRIGNGMDSYRGSGGDEKTLRIEAGQNTGCGQDFGNDPGMDGINDAQFGT